MSYGHAMVLGASVAGLLAARTLAGQFERVTIVERDRLPDGPSARGGAPQARQVHIMLLRGRDLLEGLFPGFQAALAADGAVPVDMLNDTAVLTLFGRMARAPSDLLVHTCSRDLLEHHMRSRVRALPGVTVLDGREAVGPLAGSAGAIAGVRLRRRGAEHVGQPLEELRADLVVDARGRASDAPGWLEALGYGATPETVVNARLGYASRWYRKPAGWNADWKLRLVRSRPPLGHRGGVIYPVEGERWIVTLGGSGGDFPPTDEAGFMAFAHSLPDPAFAAAIERAEPISSIYGYRRTENRWRHFERLARWPAGLVVLGDAACGFNPIHGQGMTTAAIAAETLAASLCDPRPALEARFQRRLAAALRLPWLMATGEDFRLPETEGTRPGPLAAPFQAYLDRVVAASTEDPRVGYVLTRVSHLTAPFGALLRPPVVAAAARVALRQATLGRGVALHQGA